MYWNVHLDGLERTHDLIVEREGVFKECILAMKMAKLLGYQVATNTTIYKETDMAEIEQMFDFLSDLGVDGHTISPGYEYDAAKKDMIKRLNLQPENFFLTRQMTIEKFKKIEEWMSKYTLFGTPIYFEFLAGKRDLTCSAWAIPTRNIRGWKGPCYLMTDAHYSSYAELLEKVQWDKYGVVNGVAKDSRCENCMVHCGYEPTASLGLQRATRRYLEECPVQFRGETETNRQRQRDRRLQRRHFRQRPSDRQTRRSLPRRHRERGQCGFSSANLIALPSVVSCRSARPSAICRAIGDRASDRRGRRKICSGSSKPDGHWCGELMVDSTLCSDYVLFMHWLGEVDEGCNNAAFVTF